MKYSPKKYAKALADVDEKIEDRKVVANFLALLARNGDMKKSGQILALAEQLLLKKTGNKKVMLETARKIDVDDVIKVFTKKGDIVEEKINPKLIAGVKVIVDNDRQLDLSLARKLENIF